jgi:hypothetical protein
VLCLVEPSVLEHRGPPASPAALFKETTFFFTPGGKLDIIGVNEMVCDLIHGSYQSGYEIQGTRKIS